MQRGKNLLLFYCWGPGSVSKKLVFILQAVSDLPPSLGKGRVHLGILGLRDVELEDPWNPIKNRSSAQMGPHQCQSEGAPSPPCPELPSLSIRDRSYIK